jgi:hypothetical protein
MTRLFWRTVLALCLASPGWAARAQSLGCPFPGQTPMLVVQLLLGQDIGGGRSVSPAEWRDFVSAAVTPRFPDGFTISDARGQWMDRQTHRIIVEPSKIILIAVEDTPMVRERLEAVVSLYRSRFHQQSVGVISSRSCAGF